MSGELHFLNRLYFSNHLNLHLCTMKHLFAILLSTSVFLINGQDVNQIPFFKRNTNFDLALSFGTGQFSNALSFNKYHSIGNKGKFKIGYGLRLTNYFSESKDYKTAPAKLTSGVNNPSALFKENIIENIDTIVLNKAQLNYINLAINLQYTFLKIGH